VHLLHDYKNNVETDGREALELPDLLIPEAFFISSATERSATFSTSNRSTNENFLCSAPSYSGQLP
jgi:hypothetical protein